MKGAVRIIAAAAFILWILVMWKSSSVFEPKQVSFQAEEGKEAVAAKEKTGAVTNSFLHAEELLKSPYMISRYQPLFDNNMFIKPEAPPEVFTPEKLKIISISFAPLPFMYNGFIARSDGTIIGQINWSGKTYFVKKGDKFKDYKVIEINSKILKIENKDGQITLDYKKQANGKELVAKLHNSMSDKEYDVKKGDDIGGYKIVDITIDSVVLYGQNKEWVITKGR